MSLMETTVNFKTKELFKNLLEISEYNFNTLFNALNRNPIACSSVISLGRQKGATTAISNIARERCIKGKTTIIVCPNENFKGEYQKQLKDCNFNGNFYFYNVTRPLHKLRGCSFDSMNSDYAMIFDCVKLEDADEFLLNWFHYMNMDSRGSYKNEGVLINLSHN